MNSVRLMTSSTTAASNCPEIHCADIHPHIERCLTMSASWNPVELAHQCFSKWVLFTESGQPFTLRLGISKVSDNLFKHCDCKAPPRILPKDLTPIPAWVNFRPSPISNEPQYQEVVIHVEAQTGRRFSQPEEMLLCPNCILTSWPSGLSPNPSKDQYRTCPQPYTREDYCMGLHQPRRPKEPLSRMLQLYWFP